MVAPRFRYGDHKGRPYSLLGGRRLRRPSGSDAMTLIPSDWLKRSIRERQQVGWRLHQVLAHSGVRCIWIVRS